MPSLGANGSTIRSCEPSGDQSSDVGPPDAVAPAAMYSSSKIETIPAAAARAPMRTANWQAGLPPSV